MKFRLRVAGDYYFKDSVGDMAQVPALEALGFTFAEKVADRRPCLELQGGPATIELNTLDDLVEFVQRHGKIIVFTAHDSIGYELPEGDVGIQVYNNYIE